MGEVIPLGDFKEKPEGDNKKGNPEKRQKYPGDTGPISFEREKEIVKLEREYTAFEERYKKLKFLAISSKTREKLENAVGEFVGDIETFEGRLGEIEEMLLEKGQAPNEEELAHYDRLIKFNNLRNRTAELKELAVSLLA